MRATSRFVAAHAAVHGCSITDGAGRFATPPISHHDIGQHEQMQSFGSYTDQAVAGIHSTKREESTSRCAPPTVPTTGTESVTSQGVCTTPKQQKQQLKQQQDTDAGVHQSTASHGNNFTEVEAEQACSFADLGF